MISLTSPIRTRAHDWPAGTKLLCLSAVTLGLFFVDSVWILLPAMALVVVMYALPGRAFLLGGLARLRVLWPFVAIVLLWHSVTGTPVDGAVIVLRMLVAVGLANLVTMTTRLSDMIDVLHRVTGPLARFGLNPRALDLAIALFVRMTPVLLAKGKALGDAWRARSFRRPSWRIVFPFALVALDDADHVAMALKARGGILSEQED